MPPVPTADTWASDMAWLKSAHGYGPAERDRSNGESGAADGHTLTLAGTTYEKGLGTHADSAIEVYTGGQCSKFTADVGIDDESSCAQGPRANRSPVRRQGAAPGGKDSARRRGPFTRRW